MWSTNSGSSAPSMIALRSSARTSAAVWIVPVIPINRTVPPERRRVIPGGTVSNLVLVQGVRVGSCVALCDPDLGVALVVRQGTRYPRQDLCLDHLELAADP